MSYSKRLIERLHLLEAEMEDKDSKFNLKDIEQLLPGLRWAIACVSTWEQEDE